MRTALGPLLTLLFGRIADVRPVRVTQGPKASDGLNPMPAVTRSKATLVGGLVPGPAHKAGLAPIPDPRSPSRIGQTPAGFRRPRPGESRLVLARLRLRPTAMHRDLLDAPSGWNPKPRSVVWLWLNFLRFRGPILIRGVLYYRSEIPWLHLSKRIG